MFRESSPHIAIHPAGPRVRHRRRASEPTRGTRLETEISPGVVLLAFTALFVVVAVVACHLGTYGQRDRDRTTNSKDRRGARPGPEPRAFDVHHVGELVGRAYVIDGDTIVIKRRKIRLAGIDAPELDQAFGQKSKWAMVDICKGQVITARLNGETSHDRLVGTCFLPDGRDIGAELIKRGLALDWTHYSGGKYRHLEPRGIRRQLHNHTAWR